ncbi:hypothetical protein M485_4235 (plasmid) [Yersinia pestis 14735]|nr:hypothetical protein M485_4235 [Yersinia pestis 14735]
MYRFNGICHVNDLADRCRIPEVTRQIGPFFPPRLEYHWILLAPLPVEAQKFHCDHGAWRVQTYQWEF